MKKTLQILIIAIFLWALVAYGTGTLNPLESIGSLINEVNNLMNATKLTSASHKDDETTVVESPETLAAQAGEKLGEVVGVEEYALARMLRCERTREAKGGNEAEGAAIVWVAINDANAHNGGDIVKCLTGGHGFGKQGSLRKYATSLNDPYDVDLYLVRRCLGGQIADPTGGATHFLHRYGFKDPADYESVVAKWQGYGWSKRDLDLGTSLEVWT